MHRFERKYHLSAQSFDVLRRRAAALLPPDPHSGGRYWVCNVYFDDYSLSAYHQKRRGAFAREKFRIRYYNDSLDYIRLEHKTKNGELSLKQSAGITVQQFQRLTGNGGDFLLDVFAGPDHPVLAAFTAACRTRGMRPVVAFRYYREAFCHPAANLRLTFDSAIAGDIQTRVVELKYTHFLPSFAEDIFAGLQVKLTELSKYCFALEKAGMRPYRQPSPGRSILLNPMESGEVS